MYGVHAMLVQSAPHVDSASARSGMLVFLVRLPYCFCLSSWVPTVIFLLLPHTADLQGRQWILRWQQKVDCSKRGIEDLTGREQRGRWESREGR